MSGLAEILHENARLRDELAQFKAALAERDAQLEAVQRKAEYLAERLELAQLERRGPASQRFVPAEQDLLPFDVDVVQPPRVPEVTAKSDEEPDTTAAPAERKAPRRRRREDFAHLTARPVRCSAAPATCASCGGALAVIGQAESFRIEWVPGHFVRHDVVRDKCACPNCPAEGVLTVPGPYALDKSMAGNGLVARVIVDKFADHIPANRQARRMEREGFEVGSHTISGWVRAAGNVLDVVAKAVRAEVLEAPAVQGDDTGMPVQDGDDGQLRKGRMWAFTDQDQVFYAFTDTKEGKFPNELLAGYAGRLLLVDGGSEFNEVVRTRGLKRAGCWSHLRTYFFKALHHHPLEAHLALGTLKDLFLIEREVWGEPPEVVLAARRKRSQPLVDGFYDWVRAISPVTRPSSPLGEALAYALSQRAALRVFLDHGEVPMHNNLSELMLRQTVVGRKNWLFARSEGGAKAAATMYTLIGSCYLQRVDPWHYLSALLDGLLDHPANRVAELTPKQWRAARVRHLADAT